MGMRRVWITSWEFECCGDPFGVGSTVNWTVDRLDGSVAHDATSARWFAAAIGPDEAARITDAEGHHSDSPEERVSLAGNVVAIRAAFCRFERDSGFPVAGSGWFVDKAAAENGEDDDLPDDAQFIGYLVDLDER